MTSGRQTPDPERSPATIEVFIMTAVVAAAFFEVSRPPRAFAWVTHLCALAAVAAIGAAGAVAARSVPIRDFDTAVPGRRATGPRPGPETAAPSFNASEPRLTPRPQVPSWQFRQPATRAASAAPATPAVSATSGTPTAPAVRNSPPQVALAPAAGTELSKAPRFGRGSPSHGLPWRIPSRLFPSGIAADQAQVGPFAVRGASVVGPGHRCGGAGGGPGEPRQDAYSIGRSRDDRFLVVTVADGISNARQSDVGAAVAASQASRIIRETLEGCDDLSGLDAAAIFKETAERIAHVAAGRQAAGRELATVLISAVLQAPAWPGEPARGWVAWVGDSSGWVLDAGGRRWEHRFGDAKNQGEYSTNAVSGALPDSPETVRFLEFDLPRAAAFALTTDGIADAWENAKVNRYFAERWCEPLPAAEFLNDVNFDAPQRMDDRTAVVVWNGGQP